MTAPPLPYFFDEAERAANARQPGERENHLGMTLDDLKWLRTVYLPTHASRIAQTNGMIAHRLLLTPPNTLPITLAGAFAMIRPGGGEATLYTPWTGLIKYADINSLTDKLAYWLGESAGKRELLRYQSIEQRRTLMAGALTISSQAIQGAVFQDQESVIMANQHRNLTTMLAELIKFPTLRSMLDEVLKITLARRFPGLDQRNTRLDSFAASEEPVRKVSSLSLNDALLHYYLHNHWPEGDSRVFVHPKHVVSRDADNQAWESAIKDIAPSLTAHLRSLLESFWNSAMSNDTSRLDFFAQCLHDTFCVDLLLKRQSGFLTTQEYQRLMDVSVAEAGNQPASNNPVLIEKVRITAPFKHYVELAGTLMIGTSASSAFLYTQSAGVATSGNLGQIKSTLLDMLKSSGHDDNLFNFMDLEERGVFLSLEVQERQIVGVPISGPVFTQWMADIVAKQTENLTYALSRYRESAGALHPYALLDNALDVRGLLDKRLLALEADGRWSTRADQRWSAQPAMVRADSAKAQRALLDSVDQALEQQLEQRPVLTDAITTLAQAEQATAASLALLKPKLTHTLSTALRSELKLRTISHTLGATQQSIIQTVLDTPVRLNRGVLHGFLPDVFALALNVDRLHERLKLSSCFVLTERGGLDPEHSGNAIIWTPALGFETFPSLAPLLTELNRRLRSEDERTALLENLERSERQPGRNYTLAPLELIHDDFLDHVQKRSVQLATKSVVQVLASGLPEQHRADLMNLLALDLPMTGLQRATEIVESLITHQKLPVWLANAPLKEQVLHTRLLEQYLNNTPQDKDYLGGIRSLERTAHDELKKQLKTDTYDIDPDTIDIHIEARATSAAQTVRLPAFALIHLTDLDITRFTPRSRTTTELPAAIDETYLKNLIRNLKTGERHRAELTNAFASTHPNAATRQNRFAAQVPWQLLHFAHSEQLQGRLSQHGFDLIRQVIDMPDATARDAVDGSNATVRPLALSGGKDEPAINVPGVYLIGRKTGNAGPQILLAPYSPEHGVKEYESESALLTELKTAGTLQRWVLNGVSPADRTACRTRLNAAADAPASVGLAANPIKGSLFTQLFKDNVEVLGRLLSCQSDNEGHGEWSSIKQVLSEDLGQALGFMTGKLAYPVSVWRSYHDIKASAENLQQHQWGSALKAFIRGMIQLAGLRTSMENREPAQVLPSTATACERVDITGVERTGLQRHQISDVDLSTLTRDSTLGLYTLATRRQNYVPIEGKVYPIERRGTGWIIRSHQVDGPHVRQNASKQWEFAEQEAAPRFNLLRRLKTWSTVQGGMNVKADGMADIRMLFPVRARLIDESLDLATTYVWNSFRNLQLLKTHGDQTTPVHQLIQGFIEDPTILPEHVTMIEKVILDMLDALLDPALRHAKSQRFAIGTATDDPENIFAFTVPSDRLHKIYLADKFFLPRFGFYRNYMTDASFPISAHARASTIIHELSHISCRTEDIAYLDSTRPFVDLIETSSPRAIALKNALTELQSKALSTQTSLVELFTLFNPQDGSFEDFGETTYEGSDRALAKVLSLTGKLTLNDARSAFMNNAKIRLSVKLGNADSVSWLITHLGRRLFTSTP